MSVKIIIQEEAEEYVRCLYRLWKNSGPFHDVFCHEGKRADDDLETWALPDNERIYFLANGSGKTYLYGINPQPANALIISSIGKVALYKFRSTRSLTIKSDSVLCLRELIEGFLVPLAKNSQKERIYARPQGNGVGLFNALLLSHLNNPINGISCMTREGSFTLT